MRNVIKGEKQFTVSVWLVTRSTPKKVLLVHHKKYNKWIQPGGHVEQFENPGEAAIRETKEETGVDLGLILTNGKQTKDLVTKFLRLPDFLLEQRIDAYADQPEHFHIDLQYIVEVEEQELKFSISESHGVGWFTKEEAFKLPTHEDTKLILHKLI